MARHVLPEALRQLEGHEVDQPLSLGLVGLSDAGLLLGRKHLGPAEDAGHDRQGGQSNRHCQPSSQGSYPLSGLGEFIGSAPPANGFEG